MSLLSEMMSISRKLRNADFNKKKTHLVSNTIYSLEMVQNASPHLDIQDTALNKMHFNLDNASHTKQCPQNTSQFCRLNILHNLNR